MSSNSVSGALAIAIKDILTILVKDAKHFPEFAAAFLRNVAAPSAAVVVAVVATVHFCKKTYRYLYPPSAKELYREALNLYNAPHPSRSNVAKTEQLLWEAIRRDPSWKPAMLSLVALYIYRLERPQAALKLMDGLVAEGGGSGDGRPATASGGDDPDFASLRQDAEALMESNHHMVKKLLGEDEYLSLRTAAVSCL
jgi:hypothetical protein